MAKKISIIIPAYNEAENMPALINRLTAVINELEQRYDFEMIVLDNCSTDRTGELVTEQCAKDARWKYLRYSRNFGAEASMLAGLDHASGEAVINIFSDLQDPPEYIPQMLDLWEKGADVAYGMVQERNDTSLFKTFGAKVAYWLIHHLTDIKIPVGATDFRLLDRKVVDKLTTLREPDRYYRGLVHWVGFNQVPFAYDRAKRVAGKSNANLVYCIKFACNAIVCFSAKPLHLGMIFGFFMIVSSLLAALIYMTVYFTSPVAIKPPPPGITTVILLAWLNIGINSVLLGIIGEYVGRIYNQGKNRPLYIVDQKVNF